jgi:hypothetical protein
MTTYLVHCIVQTNGGNRAELVYSMSNMTQAQATLTGAGMARLNADTAKVLTVTAQKDWP